MLDRYLVKRPRSRYWQLRIPVPKDVQGSYGRKVVTRSLKETDFIKAGERATPIMIGLRAEWDAIRHGISDGHITGDPDDNQEPSEEQLHGLAYQAFQGAKKISHRQRSAAYAESEVSYEAQLEKEEKQHVSLVRAIAADHLDRWIEPAKRFLKNRGFNSNPASPVFLKFLRMYAEATVEAINHSNKVGRGVLSPVPSSEIIRTAQALDKSEESSIRTSSFSELMDAYMQQWDAGKKTKKKQTPGNRSLQHSHFFNDLALTSQYRKSIKSRLPHFMTPSGSLSLSGRAI